MSAAGLLKNIYLFLDVLQKAHSSEAQGWAKQDVINALKWAEYCEKIHTQAITKPYTASLDEQIQTFNRLPWALGDAEITLGYFKDAKVLLQKAMLQNPYLSEDLFDTVIEIACETDGREPILKVLQSITVPKMTVHQLLLLTRKLQSTTETENVDIASRLSLECEAKLLHRHFEHLCKMGTKSDRLKSYLVQQLEAIAAVNSGMVIILMSLLEDNGHTFHSSIMIDWLEDQFRSGEETRHSFRTCSRDLLCSVAAKYATFADVYVQWLVEWGGDMTISYTPNQRPGYIYSPRSEHFSSFNDLAKHFQKLVNGPTTCRKAVIDLVLSKSKESEVSVWYELRRYLIRNVSTTCVWKLVVEKS
ncbi:uncharacterized protein LOC135494176 isoform X1 [Lineus longissimus]|uniref:uncharacterized protein LOC135494176 isoform X1 n=1 Tax=Lineus longissimus TaxID=88925 RepID=UPI002B4DFDFA